MGQVGECKNKLFHLITLYMLWFDKMLHVLKTLVNGEVSFLSNLVLSLLIKETFSYPITNTEYLKIKYGQERETNPIRIKYLLY